MTTKPRYGMVIDVDRCTGCGNCALACAVENNIPPAPDTASESKAVQWMNVRKLEHEQAGAETQSVFVPITCQQCDHHTPCENVCPQKAVEYDPESGIVTQIPVRCLGCRYCMIACPFHARYFNWWDPQWPSGMEAALNPDVSTRMRGVVEKCNFCHSRLQAAHAKAALEGRREIADNEYVPACAEVCPAQAITFGNLADERSEAAQLSRDPHAFRLLESLKTEPKVYFRSERQWVHDTLRSKNVKEVKEQIHG